MKMRLGIGIALVALVLPVAAQAGPATKQTVDVTGWVEGSGPGSGPTSQVFGEASLVRTDSGISMTFRTTGLPAGDAVTIWWIILGSDGKPVSAQFAAGHPVGSSGDANFAGHLAVGDTSGCFHPLFPCACGGCDLRLAGGLRGGTTGGAGARAASSWAAAEAAKAAASRKAVALAGTRCQE